MRQPFQVFIGVVLFWVGGFLVPLRAHTQAPSFAGSRLSVGSAKAPNWVIDLGGGFPWRNTLRSRAGLLDAISLPPTFEPARATPPADLPDEGRFCAASGGLRFGPLPTEAGGRIHLYAGFWSEFRLYAFCIFAVMGLTFAEWRWMIARRNELRALVRERTRELEAEKAELLQTKAALVQLAAYDPLTGLYNRAAILAVLERELELARRERCSFAVVLADLDHFKRVNDTYGHLIGDEVLREFTRRVRANLRPFDNAGRFGGEELLMLLHGLKDELTLRIRELHTQVTQEPFVFNGVALPISCCFGVAWFSGPLNTVVNTVEALLGLADQALYAAKANGRNRVEVAGRPCLSTPGDSSNTQLTL